MLRRLVLYFTALALLIPALNAQTALTTISDTIVGPNGSNPSGTATISWSRYQNDASPTRQIIYPGSLTLQINNGAINIALFSNAVALPTGGCYSVQYSLGGGPPSTRYWFVPVSSTPVTLNQVESSIGCTPGTAPIVAPAQINPGPAGQTTVLTSSSAGYVSWQIPTGGGGGSQQFSQILGGVNNSGQTMTVGSSSALNYSGTGIVNANLIVGNLITGISGNSGRVAESIGTLPSGDLGSFDASGNLADSGLATANVIRSTGSYSNPTWLTSISGSIVSGGLGCGALPALSGDASNSGCAITVSKTGGLAFAPSATVDTTIASNILSGTLAAARLPAINLAASGAGGVTGNLQALNVGGGSGCSTATWVRGDMSCQTIPAGGTVTNSFGALSAGAVVIGNGANDETVLPSLGTSAKVLTGNATGSPAWSQVDLTTTVMNILPGANGGSGNGFFAVSGPAGSLKTFTFPNVSAAVLTNNAAVTLAQGGLGANFSSIALGGIISGTGAGTVGITALGTNGFVLTANSGAPGGVAWSSPTTGGTVTNVTCSAPLTCSPNPITATGIISGATLVTSAAALTNNAVMLGGGLQASMTLGSSGTTTTFLQGNSSGPPSWSAVNLGTSVTGVTAAANGGSGVANTATLTLGTSNQNWATLASGIVKNTTTTGALSVAIASDVYGLWSGTCSSTTLLHGAGACGQVALTTDVSGVLPAANVAAALSSTTSVNGTSIPASGTLTQTICSGTIALSGTVNTASHTDFSVACAGLATTDNVSLDFNGSPLAVTGFIPSASGMLTVIKWPTAGTINVSAVNNTSSNITLGSTVTLNYHVFR
jgi:hypothetical protein